MMNISLLHTTELGAERIRRNLGIKTNDVVEWCRQAITGAGDGATETRGKNWYVKGDGFVFEAFNKAAYVPALLASIATMLIAIMARTMLKNKEVLS
jgi:hypothetical protein